MELLKTKGRRRSLFSEVAYYVLNLCLVALILVIAITVNSSIPALLLVLLSKWRVLAVRPRYWWVNIQANLVDLTVGVSIVLLMYIPGASLTAQVMLAAIYALWLLVIKPMSGQWRAAFQAFVAILLGTMALYSVAYAWPAAVTVIGMWLIGYSAARHVLYRYEEDQITFLSLIWGFVFAELGWITYHWAFGYSLFESTVFKVPQVTLIALALSFVADVIYRSYVRNRTVVLADIFLPTLLSAVFVLVIVAFFSSATI